jgi:hypothetical protein
MINIENSVTILSDIIKMINIMPEDSRKLWYNRIDFIYGDLQGQRAVNIDELSKVLNINNISITKEIIIALETYFF